MINQQIFKKLKAEYLEYLNKQHELRKVSSDVLKKSKQAIFALHQNNEVNAKTLIKDVEDTLIKLNKSFTTSSKLQHEGAYEAAIEEYIEAKLFYQFLTNKKIALISGIKIKPDQYIGGLCDFTGELVRRAIILAIKKEYQEIKIYHNIIEKITSELIQFDLTKILRVKYDQTKRNLKKIEEILYDISIRQQQ